MDSLLTVDSSTSPNFPAFEDRFRTLDVSYDSTRRALTYLIRPDPLPCFTYSVLTEIEQLQDEIRISVTEDLERGREPSIRYVVAASGAQNGANLGGDLAYFIDAAKSKDRSALESYAQLGVRVLFNNYMNLAIPVTTIAVLRGATLGAGLEAALSCDTIMANQQVKLGFPEVLFNMFPGMGAYSFLARRVAPGLVERMILSGKLYTAEELFDLGIVDIVAEDDSIDTRLNQFLDSAYKTSHTRNGLLRIRNRVNPISYEELVDTARIWVDAVCELSESDLTYMKRLYKAQTKQLSSQKTHLKLHEA